MDSQERSSHAVHSRTTTPRTAVLNSPRRLRIFAGLVGTALLAGCQKPSVPGQAPADGTDYPAQPPADTRTGPATRAPGDADANEPVGEGDTETDPATTQPSQDSSGVEGMPGNKSGPAVKTPGGAD